MTRNVVKGGHPVIEEINRKVTARNFEVDGTSKRTELRSSFYLNPYYSRTNLK